MLNRRGFLSKIGIGTAFLSTSLLSKAESIINKQGIEKIDEFTLWINSINNIVSISSPEDFLRINIYNGNWITQTSIYRFSKSTYIFSVFHNHIPEKYRDKFLNILKTDKGRNVFCELIKNRKMKTQNDIFAFCNNYNNFIGD